MSEIVQAGGLSIELRRSPRRRTLGLTVDRGGDLVVYVPATATEDEVSAFLNSRMLWIHTKLNDKERMISRNNSPEFVNGESVFFLGCSHPLKVVHGLQSALKFDGTRFQLDAGASDPHGVFRRWFIQEGRLVITRRLDCYQRRVNKTPSRIAIRDLGFRWGSCTARGTLNFHWKLIQLPLRLVDYVVVHELAHLSVPNHSPAFWRYLRSIMPDCMERKEELDQASGRFLRFDA
jgi:predicted metal-dependent hydrolase